MTTPEQASLNAFSARIASNSLTASDVALLTAALGSIIPQWGFGGSGQPPDLEGFGGNAPEEANAREWYALLYAIAAGSAGGGGPVVPASWLVPAWFINPVAGLDTNTGQDAAHPLKTWAQLVNLWGTVAPTLNQNTTITFQTSQPDNTDPVIFRPVIGKGVQVLIQGTPVVVTAGVVLAGTVAKNRGTGQLLNETLGATAAVGQMVRNTTAGKISRAFAMSVVAGTTFAMSQPLAPVPGFPVAAAPAEVDTWANGDTVDLLTLSAVHLVELKPILADLTAGNAGGLVVYQIDAFVPATDGTFTPCVVGTGVSFWESSAQKVLTGPGGQSELIVGAAPAQAFGNVFAQGGYAGLFGGGQRLFLGGGIPASAPGSAAAFEGDLLFDGDFISQFIMLLGRDTNLEIGFACFVTTVQLQGLASVTGLFYAGQSLWGTGTLNVTKGASLTYPAGAGSAVANLQIASLQLDSTGTGHSVIAGSPDVYNGGITTTAAHLDAAAGAAGFGGNAFNPGGGSISNFA
jgi:hypothetical protein